MKGSTCPPSSCEEFETVEEELLEGDLDISFEHIHVCIDSTITSSTASTTANANTSTKESTFGAFGSPMIGGHQKSTNDDSYVMGDEELQIVSPPSINTTMTCTESMSTSARAEKMKDPPKSSRNANANANATSNSNSNSSTGCISILNPSSPASRNSIMSEGSFDVCKEFGYKYEYTEDDSSTSTEHENENANASMSNQSSPKEGGNSLISMLGFMHLSFNENGVHLPAPVPVPTTTNTKTTGTNGSPRRKRGSRRDRDREQDHDACACAYQTYILGKTYHPINDYHAKRDDEANLFWFTYRCDFLEIKPYGITSDAGWGCMLRSAQMLFAQVMRMHFKGRGWRAERSLKMKRQDSFLRNVLSWFADYPCAPRLGEGSSTISGGGSGISGSESWYSLHNMVAAGCARYDVLPGEWFGPGTACHVLRDLVQLHRRDLKHYADEEEQDREHATEVPVEGQHTGVTGTFPGALKVYVAPEGSIYRSDLKELLVTKKRGEENQNGVDDKGNHVKSGTKTKTAFSPSKQKEQQKQKQKENDPKYHHPLYEAPLPSLESNASIPEWNASLLILVPLRLGLKQFNASSYKVSLAHMLSFPQSVGFIGGSPRHALWFYGANSDGSKVYGLDPHTVQRAPRRRKLVPQEMASNGNHGGGGRTHEIIFSDEYLRSINCPNGSAMDMTKIDPSLALGFYCRDREDYESFEMSLKAMKEDDELKKYPALFTISDAKPDYAADLSSAMMDMMMTCSSPLQDGDMDVGNRDEDDEYIML